MAEALAVVASVIAIIQATDRIVSLCRSYIECAKDAPRLLRVTLIETSMLKVIFENLKFFLDVDADVSSMLVKLGSAAESPIEGCRKCVSELEKLLGENSAPKVQGKRQKIEMVWANLAWPFKESKVEHLLDEILKYKSTINLALSSEIVYVLFHSLDNSTFFSPVILCIDS
jgi:hypothetical protein